MRQKSGINKIKTGNIQAGIDALKNEYNKVAPAYPFEYSFLDQKFDELYKKDMRQQTILTVFAGLAIFVACLGLFGLASFTATKRFKEIGVRKVLGFICTKYCCVIIKRFIKTCIDRNLSLLFLLVIMQ